jgi:hypothetical protein
MAGRRARPALPAIITSITVAIAIWAPGAHAAAIGAILGANRADISGDAPQNVEFGSRFGLIAGVQGEFGIARDVLISVQPVIVSRGATVSDADSLDGESADLVIDYFAVPIVLKLMAGGGRTYVTGGIDVAFLDKATLSSGDLEVDVTDFFNRTDVAALIGFGVVFPIGRPRLTVEARYVQGFSSLTKDDALPPDQNLPDRFHNKGLQLMAGVLFPLGRP